MGSTLAIQEYESHDSTECPAWVFCINKVIDAYGVCPFLKLEFIDQRKNWLDASHDGGQVYWNTFQRLMERSHLNLLEQQCETDRTNLDQFVRKQLDNFTVPRSALPSDPTNSIGSNSVTIHPVDYIVNSIIDYQRNVTHRTKALRITYQRVMEFIDTVLDKTGINFVRYLKIVHDTTFRYRCNTSNVPINIEYERLCDALATSQAKVFSEENLLVKMRNEAVLNLTSLMADNFNIDQVGKYFKRWTALTMEQKIERVQAFSHGFIKAHEIEHDYSDKLREFLVHAVTNHVIKSNCIKWSAKCGVIENIQGLVFDKESDPPFSLDDSCKTKSKTSTSKKSAPKSVTFADTHLESTTVNKKRASSASVSTCSSSGVSTPRKQYKKTMVTEDEKVRLNRLLLDQLIDQRNSGRTKETIVQQVLDLFSLHGSSRQRAYTYISTALDHMIDIIHENPMINAV